jgi:hypothetical protein
MFKSIIAWWKSQFLAEGESQIKYQEDVKPFKPELSEKTLDDLDNYSEDWVRYVNRARQIGLDTFTIYTMDNEVHQKQLASPVVTFLKVIKKGFDEDNINFPSRDMDECTVRVNFDDKLLFWLKFNTQENVLDFYEGFKLSGIMLEFPSSMNYLTSNERYWISRYVWYRLVLVSQAEEEKRRAATESELQELLK